MTRFSFSLLTMNETQNNVLQALLHSRKFWIAVFALIQSVVFALIPNFPQTVWLAIDGMAAVLIGAIAYEDGNKPTQ